MKKDIWREGKITMRKVKGMLTRIASLTLAILVASSNIVYADNGSFLIGDQEVFEDLPDGTIVDADYGTYIQEGTAFTTNKIIRVRIRNSGAIGGISYLYPGTPEFDDNVSVVYPTGSVAFTGDKAVAEQQVPVAITYKGVNNYVLEDPIYVYYKKLIYVDLISEVDYGTELGKNLIKSVSVYNPENVLKVQDVYPVDEENWTKVNIDSVTYIDTEVGTTYTSKRYSMQISYTVGVADNYLMGIVKVHQPSILYNGNGNTEGTTPVDDIVYGAGYSGVVIKGNEGNLKKDGKNFVCWNTKADGTGTDYSFGSNITATAVQITLYAKYEEDIEPTPEPEPEAEYKVSYDTSAQGSNGTITDNNKYKAGDEVTIRDCSSSAQAGYEVEGIYENADYSGTKYSAGDKYIISANKGFYVKYVAIGYHLSFNKNGGTGTLAEDANTYNSGDVVVLPDLTGLTRAGYKPIGFSTSPLILSKSASLIPFGSNFMCGMDMIYRANYSVFDNTLLYVTWQEEEIVAGNYITYEGNGADGGTAPVDPTDYANPYNPATVKYNTFTRTDYDFAGWNTKADGNGNSYSEGQSVGAFLILNAGKKLYAQWTPIAAQKFNLTFDMGIGAMYVSAPPTAQYDEGTEVSLPTPSTTSFMTSLTQGYSFNGWDIANPYTITADTFATAQWQAFCKVSYSGGAMVANVPFDSNSYQLGQTVTVMGPTPITEGFTFTGYYIEQLGITVQIGDTFIMPGTGANLTAQWTPNAVIPVEEKYHAYYSAGADTSIITPVDNVDYAKDDTVTVMSGIIVDGYTFKGWWCTELSKLVQPGEQLTMGKADLHFMAMLEANQPPVVEPTPTPDPTPVVTGPAIEITPTPEPTTPPEPTEEPSVTPEPTNPPAPTEEPPVVTPEPTNPPVPTEEPPVVTPEPTNPPVPTEVPPVVTPTPKPPVIVTPDPVPTTPEPTKTPESTKEPKVIYGRVFGIVIDTDGKPRVGERVELHSKPRVTYTDTEGRYSFDNVELGNHTIILRGSKIVEVSIVVVHDLTSGDKQEIKIDDTTEVVTGAVSLDENQTERQIDFELVKDLVEDTTDEEPIDDTIKDEEKKEDKVTDKGKTSEDNTGKNDDKGKTPSKVEDKAETKQPIPKPSVINPEIVDPEPIEAPEDDSIDVTLGIDGTEEPEPTPVPEVVEPTPSPDPVKPVPNPIIPIVIAIIGTVIAASGFYFFFILVRRRKYIYAVIKDKDGNVIDPERHIANVDKMLARVNLSDIADILGSLEGVTVTIEQATANKLAGYKLEIMVKDEIIKTYQFDTEIEADVIITL